MTPEERFERIERQIEFIVNQQAQFHADLQRSREEWQAELREARALMQEQIDRHEKQINTLNTAAVALFTTTQELAQAQKVTEVKMAEMAAGMRELELKSQETQERLDILINMFERYLNERRNGDAGNGGAKPS
jgi:chromosome segregation ATPase